ncbi:uncharacterized protein LOC132703217 [Cylas formicarius]|uniref:uncharacterized protein LOC132703217 n=1 Tax=Cylas formicarius TaxID=197179 RepID=UPI002958C960|nr:uncharacterized protein LOC132703217 [Cylas formicarius]
MSSNIQTLTKWMPAKIVDYSGAYDSCRELHSKGLRLIEKISYVLSNEDDKFDPKIKDIAETLLKVEEKFADCFRALQIEREHVSITKKFKSLRHLAWKTKQKLCYVLRALINELATQFVFSEGGVTVVMLRLATSYNNLLAMDAKFNVPRNGNSVCKNTCPYLLFPLKKFSVTRFLHALARKRAELCSHKLIDCLLDTYKTYDGSDDDSGSDNSSLEIYLALTKHMSPPANAEPPGEKTMKDDAVSAAAESRASFANIDEIIMHEDSNVTDLLNATLGVCPAMLGPDGIKKSKSTGESKVSKTAARKVADYYQRILWSEVGSHLEHVILWWAPSPLAARPPRSSQHLREWINQFIPTADMPQSVISALTCLADALGVHVTSTLWDHSFRRALVASKKDYDGVTGQLFTNVMEELVCLSNLCEVTPDWIVGAPLDELPLVEQIPVLHRLDHSVHTARLWALRECRKRANGWDVRAFFSITHRDVANCLTQLGGLRTNDHALEVEKGQLGVHVEVCTLMRAKLVSEVKENAAKLKDTPNQCVECLASICKTINLAHLKMIFPGKRFWKGGGAVVPEAPCGYVRSYLEKMLIPVLRTTADHQICNMVLTLVCESWLDHIYANKIKFSSCGAWQLLCDFASVSAWIEECPVIDQATRRTLLKNEVLKRCEGVGKLLLRNPGERIRMIDKQLRRKSVSDHSSEEESKEHMPAEMYVPNQEQWLELRAARNKFTFNPLCC